MFYKDVISVLVKEKNEDAFNTTYCQCDNHTQ